MKSLKFFKFAVKILSVSKEHKIMSKKVLNERIDSFIKDIVKYNTFHMETLDPEEYQNFATQQNPRATVILCSDSRVDEHSFNFKPVNDVFVIRNIGNQIINASGSVEYGVTFLKTPILMIVGHSGCGAVDAVVSGVDLNNPFVEREIATLDLEGLNLKEAIIINIHNQISYALRQFKKKVKSEELLVIGALYDFQNTYKEGLGKLIIVNVNGEKDPDKILENPYFQNKDITLNFDRIGL
jgi:carbonic anhydrase